MNYFLLVVILAICGGSYYEYTKLQETIVSDEQEISDLKSKVDTLNADNKKLGDEKAQLFKSEGDDQLKIADDQKKITDDQAKVTDLTAQIQAAKQQIAQLQPPAATPPPATPTPPPSPNDLGTITTLGGKTFKNCQLLKVEPDGITFKHTDGITKVLFTDLSVDLQKKFNYDPLKVRTSGN